MKCQACDQVLSDREASRKSLNTGEYLDLCDTCLEPIAEDVYFSENTSLSNDRSKLYHEPFIDRTTDEGS